MACEDCSVPHATAERLDIWVTAAEALDNRKWPSSYDVDPQDVMILALFLAGENSGGN